MEGNLVRCVGDLSECVRVKREDLVVLFWTLFGCAG